MSYYSIQYIIASSSLLQIRQLYSIGLFFLEKNVTSYNSLLLLYQERAPLIVYLEESISRTIFLLGSYQAKTKVLTSRSFIVLKIALYLSIQRKGVPFLVRFIKGITIVEKLGINSLQQLVNPINLQTLQTEVGYSYSYTAWIFSRSTYIPLPISTINLRYLTLLVSNLYLSISIYRPIS